MLILSYWIIKVAMFCFVFFFHCIRRSSKCHISRNKCPNVMGLDPNVAFVTKKVMMENQI